MNNLNVDQNQSSKLDGCGAIASSVCAIHCAICALLPAIFAELGLAFLSGHMAEWFFTLLAISIAALAFASFWKRHRSRLVAFFFVAGILGLLSSRLLESFSGHHDDHHDHGKHYLTASESAHNDENHGEHHAKNHDQHKEEKGHSDHDKESHNENHHDEHLDSESEKHDDDLLHMAGSMLGVISGLLLLLGHVFNIRALRNLIPKD